jgi:hypothetical protein
MEDTSKLVAKQLSGKIQSMFIKGLGIFAKSESAAIDQVQLLLTLGEGLEPQLSYKYAVNWIPKRDTTIKEALDTGLDLLGLTNLVPPAITNVMKEVAGKMSVPVNELAFFLYTDNQAKTVGVAIFHGSKNVRICPISELFEDEE